jgi:hypothetical protein
MLPSRPSFAIGINVFGEIWTTHKNLSSLGTSSRDQSPRFHTLRFVQGIEIRLDEHKRTVNMFQQAA